MLTRKAPTKTLSKFESNPFLAVLGAFFALALAVTHPNGKNPLGAKYWKNNKNAAYLTTNGIPLKL